MPDSKYDSGAPHVVVNVLHPSGEMHAISMEPSTPIPDLVNALSDSGYEHLPLETKQEQPTAEGAIENSQPFRDAATKAWNEAGQGTKLGEAAALIQNNGKSIPMPYSPGHDNKIPILSTTMGTIHTHPNGYGSHPSDTDIADAKKIGKTFWVISKDGMYGIDPKGQVTKVYDSTSDIANKKKLAK